jgi:hypothetical protein
VGTATLLLRPVPQRHLIRPVDTSLLDAVAKTAPALPAQSGAADAAGKNAFQAQLKREAAKVTDTKPAADAAPVANRVTPPEDEKWRPVKGRDDYAEIVAGDRKGQFVNLNRGARRGEAFTIEERDGGTVHVYKKADGTELAVPVEIDNKEARAAGTRISDREPPKGETWGPVKGHQSYADVLTGPRNGYYVNLQQGSAREGDVFHIVKRSGKEFHVYGEGDKKVWVEVGVKKKDDAKTADTASGTAAQPASGAADTRDASTPSTGGTAAAAVV